MNRIKSIVTTFCLLLLTLPAFAASVRISVDMPRGKRSVAVGDVFYMTVTVTDTDASVSKPQNVPGATLMYFDRTGQSSSFTSVNGKATQSYSYTYTATLKAKKEGTYTFGPISVGNLKSNTVKYTIGAQGADPAPAPSASNSSAARNGSSSAPVFIGKGDSNLFLRASVSKPSAYEQEAIVYTVKLYTTYDVIKFIGASAAPKFDGFVIEESKDISSSLDYENYNGKTYATAVIARYIIFPQMSGTLKVSANTYTVSVDESEYYHDPYFGTMSVSRPLQLNVTPNDLNISVKPLPTPKPADFSGGVGKFSISASLPSSELKTNQTAAIAYTVNGTGNLKYIHLPDLNTIFPTELEVFSPETDVKTTVGSTNVAGTAKFDYSFTPLQQGSFTIPPVKLVYFNPATGKYETAVSAGFNVNVGKGTGSDKSQTKSRLRFDSDLMPMMQNLSAKHILYIENPFYWLWYIIPVILLVAAAIYYRKYISDHSNIEALRSRKAGKVAQKRLRRVATCLRKNDSDKFYDEILTALWGYLGDKLKMPSSELTRNNVFEELTNHNVSDELAKRVIFLIDECELTKYSPLSGSRNMQNVYSDASEIIDELDVAFNKKMKK